MENILIGMSGGVDSSVAAYLLKEQGFDVIGVTMSIWGNRNGDKNSKNTTSHRACFGPNEKEDIETAKKVCEQIGIPFYVIDCSKEYDEIVLKYFKNEYLSGRTPNPCIKCNSLIKFSVLPFFAKKQGINFEKFATGHYARVCEKDGRYILKTGIDKKKDQSYFLYRLTQKQLKNILLPLGEYTKTQIREIAKEIKLEAADKPDSQDFYEGDYNELLGVSEKEGNIVNREGKILGKHKGIWNYTIGQRKGLGVSSTEALYVVELKKDTNEVVVDFKDKTIKNTLIASDLNWISFGKLKEKLHCWGKIRSTQSLEEVIVYPLEDNKIKVEFINMQKSISPGQSVVLYDNDEVLGGGIIEKKGEDYD